MEYSSNDFLKTPSEFADLFYLLGFSDVVIGKCRTTALSNKKEVSISLCEDSDDINISNKNINTLTCFLKGKYSRELTKEIGTVWIRNYFNLRIGGSHFVLNCYCGSTGCAAVILDKQSGNLYVLEGK